MAIGNLPPFEDRGAYGGFFPALFQTWINACFRPAGFFSLVGNSQDLSPALLFGVLVGWVSSILFSLWSFAFQALSLAFQALLLPIALSAALLIGGLVGWVSFILFSLPLALQVLLLPIPLCAIPFGWLPVLLGIFIVGLIIHLFLILFGGANQGLTMTLRVICYACAPQIFAAVPLVGWFIASIWFLALEIIGLAAAHRTDTWRAALAVLAPIILGICVSALFCAVIFAGMQQ